MKAEDTIEKFDCEKCGKSFDSKHIMMFHSFRICGKNICPQNNKNSIVNCRKCNTGFSNENSFMNHLNNCNGDGQKRRENNSPNKSKLETDDQVPPPPKQPKLDLVPKEIDSVEQPEAAVEVNHFWLKFIAVFLTFQKNEEYQYL